MQGPEQYLNELGITLNCAVNPALPAVIDAEHRKFVNYEAYFFSDEAAERQFLAEPYRYTGKVTDPVSLERFVPKADSPMRSYGPRLFYFSSDENAAAFDKDVARYSIPMPGMREKKPAQG